MVTNSLPDQGLQDGADDEGPAGGAHHGPQAPVEQHHHRRHAAQGLLACAAAGTNICRSHTITGWRRAWLSTKLTFIRYPTKQSRHRTDLSRQFICVSQRSRQRRGQTWSDEVRFCRREVVHVGLPRGAEVIHLIVQQHACSSQNIMRALLCHCVQTVLLPKACMTASRARTSGVGHDVGAEACVDSGGHGL